MKPIKAYFKDALWIAVGCLILAVGINQFMVPNQISSGGISSIATVLLYAFRIPMSVTNLVTNAVLFFFGFRSLKKYAIVKTVEGILFLSLFLQLTSYLPVYTEDRFLATVVGGILAGIGVGLVVRRGGSTGGSDFAAWMVKKRMPHVSLATLILIMDCIGVLIAGLVFGSTTVTFLSLIAMYLSSKVTDAVVTVGDAAKAAQIFSSHAEEIANVVMARFERGVTGIFGKGMYTGREGLHLLCVVSPKELPALIRTAREIDPTAFIVINDAREVFGEGFKNMVG